MRNCLSVYAALAAILGVSAIHSTPALSAGQAVGIKHPVLQHDIDPAKAAQYEAAVERVMAMSDEEMLSFVPDRPATRFCDCPNCHGGSQGSGIYSWSIDAPEQVTCKYCGMVFPNDQYPLDQVIEGENSFGEKFSYRYHQDKVRDDLKIHIPGHILMYRRGWIMGQAKALAVAYQATQKPEYARRAVLILDRVAQLYPHYPMMRQWITTFEFGPQQPPYPSAGGKWGRWMASELPAGVAQTYDLVYDSDEFDKLSAVRGYDVREKFENDFLKATWEYTNTWDTHTGNMAPFYLQVAAEIGWVINEPHYLHWARKWLVELLMGGCFYDGMWHEAPSYHSQVIGGLRTGFNALRGWSDPEGYIDEDGTRFDDFDPDRDIAFFAKAQAAPTLAAFPNGIMSPIHDTWPNSRAGKPTQEAVSTILPGYGHASLGCGVGSDQVQAQLHFSGAYGHSHRDTLNLTLFGKEREMLSDVGYTHTRVRSWSVDTVGHNLVAVDRSQQGGKPSDGDLLTYLPNANGVSVVEADGVRAYGNIEGMERYRRMLVLIPTPDGNAYCVDVFRVRGGRTHDWLVHGSADDDMTAACNIALTPGRENLLEEGEEWVEPRTEGSSFNAYGAIREVSEGATDGDVEVTFTYTDEPERGVRVHLLGGGATQVYLGKSPSVRKAGSDGRVVWDYWMPQLVARRIGEAPLQSDFIAVEEPFLGEPLIDSIEAVEVTPTADGVAALRIRYGDVTDTIISTLDEADAPARSAGGVTLAGRLGIVRERAGKVVGAWLLEGTRLTAADMVLSSEIAAYTGELSASARRADGAAEDVFITDADLPLGDMLAGSWMIVTHPNGFTHGYEIARVEQRDGRRVIVLKDDHGLVIDGATTREVYYPRREMQGANGFRIPVAATMVEAL